MQACMTVDRKFKKKKINWSHMDYIYIYAFSRRFYPRRLTIAFGLYIFISMCVPWESNPQPFAFALLTQCSTTEPHRITIIFCNVRFLYNL